ncbi:hypothetical protein, partial [uncultured Bilophila sp.]|uniref:hypothetical protein n=1 Tax=uncultured Bilophila sp. TaxID=529385 RepID=UPI00280B7EBC
LPHTPSSLPPKTFDLIESLMAAFPFYRECRLFLKKRFLLLRPEDRLISPHIYLYHSKITGSEQHLIDMHP